MTRHTVDTTAESINFFVISLFPEMIEQICSHGVLGRAIKRGLLSVHCLNPRDYTHDRHQTVDDRPYGGGPGMLMKWQPLADAINAARKQASADARVVYMSPQGKVFNQQAAAHFAQQARQGQDWIILAGRYEGIDERLIEQLVDEQWSIGDYVLSGGELAVMVVIDAIARLCPGVLGDAASAQQDSFMQGLLDCPHYTRPEMVNGCSVPAVLLSGDHQAISQWRLQQALGRTWERRPDLILAAKAGSTDINGVAIWDENKERLLADYIKAQQTVKNM